jgi:hypothetical protein
MKYVIAWAVFGLLVYGALAAVHSWKNPWAIPAAVIQLPPASHGCDKDCAP